MLSSFFFTSIVAHFNESLLQLSIDGGLLDLIKKINRVKLVWPLCERDFI